MMFRSSAQRAVLGCCLLASLGCSKGDPSAADAPLPTITTKSGVEMVLIPAGSFDMGSLMPEKEKPREEAKPVAAESAVSAGNVSEAQSHTAKAQALAKSGDTAAALDEFNQAIALDPYNAQALYGRALVYQGNSEHDSAIADFGAANGLNPQKVEPLLGRAISYLAIGKVREAAADLDEASEADPHNTPTSGVPVAGA